MRSQSRLMARGLHLRGVSSSLAQRRLRLTLSWSGNPRCAQTSQAAPHCAAFALSVQRSLGVPLNPAPLGGLQAWFTECEPSKAIG